MSSPLVCQVRERLPVALVSLYGTLDERSVVGALVSLRDCLADLPTALVLDATHLAVSTSSALAPVSGLARQALRWPGSRVLLCAASPAVRRLVAEVAGGGEVSLREDTDSAMADARSWPVPPRIEAELVPGRDMPAACRDLVGRACTTWGVPRLRRLAELIISELASNAVRHAGTPVRLTLRRTGSDLEMAVRDGDPRLVHHPAPGTSGAHQGEHGRGLLILDAMADAWGSEATGDGKVVWARVALP